MRLAICLYGSIVLYVKLSRGPTQTSKLPVYFLYFRTQNPRIQCLWMWTNWVLFVFQINWRCLTLSSSLWEVTVTRNCFFVIIWSIFCNISEIGWFTRYCFRFRNIIVGFAFVFVVQCPIPCYIGPSRNKKWLLWSWQSVMKLLHKLHLSSHWWSMSSGDCGITVTPHYRLSISNHWPICSFLKTFSG